jgi:progressive ankylosis protein
MTTATDLRIRHIFHLWLPLAVSFELMMLEGPAVQGAIGRLPDPTRNLAAWGLTMSLSLLVESPVIMLLATAIALVKDTATYRALRRFTVNVALACTVLTGLVAYTPLFGVVAGKGLGYKADVVLAAQPAMQIMLFWTAAIAWRRFYQGILVRYGQTRKVSFGTAIRLCAAVTTAVILARSHAVTGVQVGALALMVAVVTEAFATTCFALPAIRRYVPPQAPSSEPLSQRAILSFHTPLAATTLLTLLAMPITSAALARLDHPRLTLAAAPVVFLLLLVMRGWGLAVQEISVAQARLPEARPALKKFTRIIGLVTTGATALIAFTPLLDLYLDQVIRAPGELKSYIRVGVGVGAALPLVTALGSWARGLLVSAGATNVVYRGMALNLGTHAALLVGGVALRLPGMVLASGAFTLAAGAEYLYLRRKVASLYTAEEHAKAVATDEETCTVMG